ncbi:MULTISPECIES: hypothetical protein [Acidobacterium]|uniref:Putative membrane protein n=1 Tax=Acidobacterium capsulatum (strain ATCC 51196 / DSM 11244 / BCRC 80197 / JCM 7670 / NBRC 15755 / NCIMB 13165 / 161) TaxID=240015 RepID=C1F1J5_ACIC5|nr:MULTISPECIES: hypothetical protein [Acidobacterium]ACO32928.1 putative membrane protein [Acidobacterium capsulatum ATCC 51196]HCT61383.1 hypothetical protein [Acidobacterium sp.]
MTTPKRPLSVLVVACLYLLVGCIGFVYHFHNFHQLDFIWIELTEALAIVAGAFLLQGRNWARWLAIAWMAFHVAISYGDWHKLVIHFCIFVLITWLLFRADARSYFRAASVS